MDTSHMHTAGGSHPQKKAMLLRVRPFETADFASLYALLSDPEAMRFLEPPYTREQTAAFLLAALGDAPPVLAVEWDGAFIGYVIFHPYELDSMEIGWVLLPAYWGMGCASALTEWMICKAASMGKKPVIECDPGQTVTKCIAANFGFARIGSREGLEVYSLP